MIRKVREASLLLSGPSQDSSMVPLSPLLLSLIGTRGAMHTWPMTLRSFPIPQ